ncbi:armadillo-type protein [Suillus americanus]|nr:armadillo-type protein [Suillus americanus]
MQSLLRWSVENSTPSTGPPPTTTNKLDPGIIDHILGKPDAQLMREALIIGVDERQTEDDRLQALDDLEMLVQNIDNANDLEKLGLWQPLHNLLQSPNTTDTLKMQTLWIIGTALQNNPAAQLAYLNLEPLPILLKSLSPTPSNSAETRSRALYALSGFLKLNAAAVQQMGAVGGWSALRMCLEDSEIRVRRKTTFLLNTLLLPTSSSQVNLQPNINLPTSETAPPQIHANSHASMLSDPSSVSTSALTLAAIQEEGEEGSLSLLDALISALIEPVPFGVDGEVEKDEEYQENVVRWVRS